MLHAPQTTVRYITPKGFDQKLIPKYKGTYSVSRMSPLRKTYLTGCGADQRDEGKRYNHCIYF